MVSVTKMNLPRGTRIQVIGNASVQQRYAELIGLYGYVKEAPGKAVFDGYITPLTHYKAPRCNKNAPQGTINDQFTHKWGISTQ